MSKKEREKLKTSWQDPVNATLIQRQILNEKYLLRRWYEGLYRFMADNIKPGRNTVELGSGSSYLYTHIQGLIKTNVIHIPDNDMTFSAYDMPFENNSVDNIILISVFHHFDRPERFLAEAARVLKHKGKILISDPYISMLSMIPWKYLHPEGCDLSRIGFDARSDNNPLLDANSANCTLMFTKKNADWQNHFPDLKIIRLSYHTMFHYWLAGGYNLPPLAPRWSLPVINFIERLLSPFGRVLASFLFVVIEKGYAERGKKAQ